jgi:hypothetical protein
MAGAANPLTINFFATGLYTHRSALFSPYRAIGVNVVTYHDAAIGGQDMEIGASLEWKRRPGFARFCSQVFGISEYPLQFYSARQPAGTVVSFVDTNENFSTFSSSAITPLVSKSTTAQGFIQQVGGMTYYANGKDLKKWNGSVTSGWGTAAPTAAPTINETLPTAAPSFWASNVTIPVAWLGWITDYNGNIEFGVAGASSHVTGPTEPIWSIVTAPPLGAGIGAAAQGGLTLDGTFNWRNMGPASLAVWAANTAVGLNAILIDQNGNLEEATVLSGSNLTGSSAPTWNTTVGGTTTDNDVTWTNRGPATLSVQAGYTYGYGFRTIYGHLSTLSPLLTIGAVMGALSVPLTGSGTTDSQCEQTITITSVSQTNGILSVTASGSPILLAGQNYQLSGFSGGDSFLNTHTIGLESVTGNTFTAFFIDGFTHADFGASGGGSGAFCGVEIYRTADGGGVLYFDMAIPNAPTWTFTDTTVDSSLDTDLIGPTGHLNDPPPGTSGSLVAQGGTILAYWQGRVWMAVGNLLYFDAGPDCINGVPEESWPPANVFQYPGPITGLVPSSQGLLVWGSDYLSMALGGPQTLSFFPYDLMKNFGVSSPNCVCHDGDTIYAFLTSGQLFMLNDSGKSETGNYIVDQLKSFAPASSYVSLHRNGTDSGVWIGDGSTNMFRYSLNIGAWSTEYKPVGGLGAFRSVETSVGVYTLCGGRTSGGGYILGRSLTSWQDDGQNYSNCFVTIGSITLTPPGATLVPVEHIVGYFDAVGSLGPTYDSAGNPTSPTGGPTVPTVSILPNEQSATAGPGFIALGQPKSEYTTAQLQSSSMLSLRWDVDSMNVANLVSQWMHHIQVMISFPPENAPHTVKQLSIVFQKNP